MTPIEIIALAAKIGGFLLAAYEAVEKLVTTSKALTVDEFRARAETEKARILNWLSSSDKSESDRFPK